MYIGTMFVMILIINCSIPISVFAILQYFIVHLFAQYIGSTGYCLPSFNSLLNILKNSSQMLSVIF